MQRLVQLCRVKMACTVQVQIPAGARDGFDGFFSTVTVKAGLPGDELPLALVVHEDGQLLPDDSLYLQRVTINSSCSLAAVYKEAREYCTQPTTTNSKVSVA